MARLLTKYAKYMHNQKLPFAKPLGILNKEKMYFLFQCGELATSNYEFHL